jgi:hypothetical protein
MARIPRRRDALLCGSWAALNPNKWERIGTLNLENAEHRTSSVTTRCCTAAAFDVRGSVFGVRCFLFRFMEHPTSKSLEIEGGVLRFMGSFHQPWHMHWDHEPVGQVGRVSPLRAATANRCVRIVPDGAHGVTRPTPAGFMERGCFASRKAPPPPNPLLHFAEERETTLNLQSANGLTCVESCDETQDGFAGGCIGSSPTWRSLCTDLY